MNVKLKRFISKNLVQLALVPFFSDAQNKTAAANRLRLLNLDSDDNKPVLVAHFTLLPERLFNCINIKEKGQTATGQVRHIGAIQDEPDGLC